MLPIGAGHQIDTGDERTCCLRSTKRQLQQLVRQRARLGNRAAANVRSPISMRMTASHGPNLVADQQHAVIGIAMFDKLLQVDRTIESLGQRACTMREIAILQTNQAATFGTEQRFQHHVAAKLIETMQRLRQPIVQQTFLEQEAQPPQDEPCKEIYRLRFRTTSADSQRERRSFATRQGDPCAPLARASQVASHERVLHRTGEGRLCWR